MRAAAAEGDVRVGGTGDVKPVGVDEGARVTVARWVPHGDPVASPDLHPADLDVIQGGAPEVEHRAGPADDLVYGGAQ